MKGERKGKERKETKGKDGKDGKDGMTVACTCVSDPL